LPEKNSPGRLTQSELLLITDYCPDVLWSYNLEQQRWNYISPSVKRLGGYSVDEALACPLERFLTAASYQLFIELTATRLEQFLKDESVAYMSRDEVEVVCKDGSTVWCDVTSQCVRNEMGLLTLTGAARPIIERYQPKKDLCAHEESFREILNSIEEGYYECNLEGYITFLNDAACHMYGYSRDEFAGIDYKMLYIDHAKVREKFKQVYFTGKPESGFTLEMCRKDGIRVHIEISVSPIYEIDGTISGFRGMARDVTEKYNFQQQLEYLSMHDQLTGLYNRNYFEEELRRLSKSRDYPITMISADVNGLKLINDTMGHEHGDRLLKAAADVLEDCLRGSDVLARVGGDEFTAVLPNTDEATAGEVIKRIRSTIRKFCEEHHDLYLSLSLGAATAHNPDVTFTELFKQADDAMYKDKFEPSAIAKNKIMKGLMDALAEKDYLTEGHARRLGAICHKVGSKIGLSTRRLADLALLTQVHDLGKVGIPDQIIYKSGELTPDEWKIMKQHPEKGYRIALSSNYMTNVASLILKHHEHWDGSGYPLGLKGMEIPVECRIFSIADAFDTITSDRPYNKAKSREAALSEIKYCAGKQFDPHLAALFLEVMSEEQFA
jgi:diguanylate cyclase (GGDEF)-like protein/PAS domain S-box-containing protein